MAGEQVGSQPGGSSEKNAQINVQKQLALKTSAQANTSKSEKGWMFLVSISRKIGCLGRSS